MGYTIPHSIYSYLGVGVNNAFFCLGYIVKPSMIVTGYIFNIEIVKWQRIVPFYKTYTCNMGVGWTNPSIKYAILLRRLYSVFLSGSGSTWDNPSSFKLISWRRSQLLTVSREEVKNSVVEWVSYGYNCIRGAWVFSSKISRGARMM